MSRMALASIVCTRRLRGSRPAHAAWLRCFDGQTWLDPPVTGRLVLAVPSSELEKPGWTMDVCIFLLLLAIVR